MKIAIVGAGIGGLTTALSLEAAGFREIHVYERSARIAGLGVGINLLPHAMRELSELGFAARIRPEFHNGSLFCLFRWVLVLVGWVWVVGVGH